MRSFLKKLARQLPGDLGVEVARGAGVVFFIQTGGAGLSYLLHVVLARVLGASGYGVYSYVIAWLALLAVPAGLGLNTALVRFVPEYREDDEFGLLRGVTRRSWQMVTGVGIVLALAGTGLIVWWGDRLPIPYDAALLIGLWIVPLRALVGVQVAMGRGLKRMTLAYLPGQVIRPLLVVGAVGAAAYWGLDLDAVEALVLTGGAYLVTVLGQGVILDKNILSEAAGRDAEFRTRRWLRISLPMLLIAGAFLLLKRTDVVMLGSLAEAADVGTYNAAARTANLTSFVLMAVNAIAAPSMAPLFRKDEHDRLQDLASTVAHLAFWPSLIIGLLLIVLGPFVLSIFGEAFVAGQGVLAILVAAHVVNVSVGSVGYLMNMTGNQDEMARVVGIAAVINVVLNAALIPQFGALGAALATGGSMMAWNVWLNRIVVARLSIRPSIVFAVRRLVEERLTPDEGGDE